MSPLPIILIFFFHLAKSQNIGVPSIFPATFPFSPVYGPFNAIPSGFPALPTGIQDNGGPTIIRTLSQRVGDVDVSGIAYQNRHQGPNYNDMTSSMSVLLSPVTGSANTGAVPQYRPIVSPSYQSSMDGPVILRYSCKIHDHSFKVLMKATVSRQMYARKWEGLNGCICPGCSHCNSSVRLSKVTGVSQMMSANIESVLNFVNSVANSIPKTTPNPRISGIDLSKDSIFTSTIPPKTKSNQQFIPIQKDSPKL